MGGGRGKETHSSVFKDDKVFLSCCLIVIAILLVFSRSDISVPRTLFAGGMFLPNSMSYKDFVCLKVSALPNEMSRILAKRDICFDSDVYHSQEISA